MEKAKVYFTDFRAHPGLNLLQKLEKLCRAAAGAVRVLIAVLAVFALLMVVSTSVIAFCGKGGGA